MAAGEVAAALKVAPSTLSFHLGLLEQAGLIRSTRQGRHIIYAVRFAGLRELLSFLTETCCAGRPELCGDLARLLPDDIDEETTMEPAFNVLFICTRNSARSIMAEAILEKIGRGKFNAYSAGSDPARAPMPEVLDRLEVMGHDVSRLRSKSWNEFTKPDAPRMDFVLTLCDPAEGETCPDLGEKPLTATWPFPDPAKFSGIGGRAHGTAQPALRHDPPSARGVHQPAVRHPRTHCAQGAPRRTRRQQQICSLGGDDEGGHQRHGPHGAPRSQGRVRCDRARGG